LALGSMAISTRALPCWPLPDQPWIHWSWLVCWGLLRVPPKGATCYWTEFLSQWKHPGTNIDINYYRIWYYFIYFNLYISYDIGHPKQI
jgi:hypothetical protein